MSPTFTVTESNFKFIMACVNASTSINYDLLVAETGLSKDAAYKKLWALKKKYPAGSGALKLSLSTPLSRKKRVGENGGVVKMETPRKRVKQELEELGEMGKIGGAKEG